MKRLLKGALALLLAVCMTACGGGNTTKLIDQTPNGQTVTTNNLTGIMPIDVAMQLKRGTLVEVQVTREGTRVQKYQGKILGQDFINGHNVLAISMDTMPEKGMIQGDSGSPCFVNGDSIGAHVVQVGCLAYGDVDPRVFWAVLTDEMLNNLVVNNRSTRSAGTIRPLPMRWQFSRSYNSNLPMPKGWDSSQIVQLSNNQLNGIGRQVIEPMAAHTVFAQIAGSDDEANLKLVEAGAYGTLSYVTPDYAMAFGHPFLGSNDKVKYPIYLANMLGVIAAQGQVGYKEAVSTGQLVGVVTKDREMGIFVDRHATSFDQIKVVTNVKRGNLDQTWHQWCLQMKGRSISDSFIYITQEMLIESLVIAPVDKALDEVGFQGDATGILHYETISGAIIADVNLDTTIPVGSPVSTYDDSASPLVDKLNSRVYYSIYGLDNTYGKNVLSDLKSVKMTVTLPK